MKLDDDGKIIYDKNGEMEYTTEDTRRLVRHSDMIACVKEGKESPEVSAYRIEALSGKKSNCAHRVVSRQYKKKTFTVANSKSINLFALIFRAPLEFTSVLLAQGVVSFLLRTLFVVKNVV
jgi:hypothetical protein